MKRIIVLIIAFAIVLAALASAPDSVSADGPKPPTSPTPVATWPAKSPRPNVVPSGGGPGGSVSTTPVISATQVISTNVIEIRGSNLVPAEDQYAYVVGYGDDFPWGYTLANNSKWDTNVITWTANLIQFTYPPCTPFVKGELYVRVGDYWYSNYVDYVLQPVVITPNDVVVSNLTDRSASISFLTKEETCGIIVHWSVGNNRYSTMRTAYNWIAWPTSREHWTQIGWGELEAQKAYNFNIILNGLVSYTGTFTTTATPALSLPDPAYGYVYLRSNSAAPVKGALVYLTYTVGLTPTVLSTFSSSDGSWIINRSSTSTAASTTSNLRVQGGGGSTMELRAVNHQGLGYATLYSDCQCWPYYLSLGEIKTVNILLGVGWNSVALPVDPLSYYRISDMVADSDNAISGVYMYGTQGWTGTVVRGGRLFGNDMGIWSGTGMMVSATKPSTITITGYVPTSNSRYLYQGWNFVSWAVASTTTASDVSNDAGKITGSDLYYIKEIDRWIYGHYEGHVSGYTFNDFPIQADQGYFVFARSRGLLTPSQPFQPQ